MTLGSSELVKMKQKTPPWTGGVLVVTKETSMPSLSQKYRPKRFADVTGQRAVTETLRREVATGKLGHVFLFSGPRGVGKTTSARILAKALNCLAPEEGEPCGACTACVSFEEGKQYDVIELDAATHTGVDTIREAIIEHVRFAPAGKRKVYILDEAHMLSTSSWNALLKTFEEPPAYAFFVLATTEWHKVPVTIISRAQRFEFKRISETDLEARLQTLAQQEGWILDSDVARRIARQADGCVRDAETLLTQLGGLGETHLTAELAELLIPSRKEELVIELFQAWGEGDEQKAHQLLFQWYETGVSLGLLIDDGLSVLRELLLAKANPALESQWKAGGKTDQDRAGLLATWNGERIYRASLNLLERRKEWKAGLDALFVLQLATVAFLEGSRPQGPAPSPVATPAPVTTPTPSPVPRPIAQAVSTPTAPIHASKEAGTPESPKPAPVEAAPVPTPAIPAATQGLVAASDAGVLSIATVRTRWNAFVKAVEEKNHSLPFILKLSKPDRVENGTLYLRLQYTFHRDKLLGDIKTRRLVEDTARAIFEAPGLLIEGIIETATTEEVPTSPQDTVGNILKAFGGSVIDASS